MSLVTLSHIQRSRESIKNNKNRGPLSARFRLWVDRKAYRLLEWIYHLSSIPPPSPSSAICSFFPTQRARRLHISSSAPSRLSNVRRRRSLRSRPCLCGPSGPPRHPDAHWGNCGRCILCRARWKELYPCRCFLRPRSAWIIFSPPSLVDVFRYFFLVQLTWRRKRIC